MIDAAGTDVPEAGYPALAMAVTGVMLVLGAFWGRAGGLILVGLVAAVATLGGTASERAGRAPALDLHADHGRRGARQLRHRHRRAGRSTSPASPTSDDLDGRRVTVDGGVGLDRGRRPAGHGRRRRRLRRVSATSTSSGQESGGFDVQQDGSVDGGDEVPDMTIEVDLGIGQVTVREQ